MGAVFQYDYFSENCTPSEAKKKVEQMISSYIAENGFAGYTGSWSEVTDVEVRTNRVFANQAQAQDWLEEHAEKWGPALIVPVKNAGWSVGAWCSS